MKKTALTLGLIALSALLVGGSAAQAQISTSASAAAAAAAIKDPVAVKLMDVRHKFDVARASCEKLADSEQKNCFSKTEQELKRAEAEVKTMFKLSDSDFAKKVNASAEVRGELKTDDRGQNRGEDKKDDSKKNDDRRGIAEKGFAAVIKQLNAVYTRFMNIADRIDSRIKVLKSEGSNTSESEKHMTAARADLSAAKGHIETAGNRFKKELETVATSTISRTSDNSAFVNTKASIKAAKESLRSAHKHFQEALKALKPISEGKKVPVTDATVGAGVNVNVQ